MEGGVNSKMLGGEMKGKREGWTRRKGWNGGRMDRHKGGRDGMEGGRIDIRGEEMDGGGGGG